MNADNPHDDKEREFYLYDGFDEAGAYYNVETLDTALKNLLARQGIGKSYTQTLRDTVAEARARRQEGKSAGGLDPSENDDLTGGMEARPRDIEAVAAGCPHIANTLAAIGANLKNEPQWRNVLRVADRCDDREGVAARLCEKGLGYNPEDNLIKLATITKDREDNKRGFPQCADIERNGAQECATCQYRAYNKSPLSTPEANGLGVGFQHRVTQRVSPSAGAQAGAQAKPSQGKIDAHYGVVPEAVGEDGEYQTIPGGWYNPSDENVARLNRRFCLVNEGPDTIWCENRGPAGWIERPEKDLQRGLGNVFVSGEAGAKRRDKGGHMLPWFHEHKGRNPPLQAVFKPNEGRFPAEGEFNMWQGWGVEPNTDYWAVDAQGNRTGALKPPLDLMLRHLLHGLCSGDQGDGRYALNWHAWVFQNWGTPAHTIPIYKDDNRGTGKSLWCEWLVKLGGEHASMFLNKEHLLGKHAVHEYLCLAILDDIIVERDHKAQDVIKGMATTRTRVVEPKGRAQRKIVNRVTMAVTSNHNAPLLAGVNERRQFVPKVNGNNAQDPAYFAPLLQAAANGGLEMMLGFFLSMPLNGWTPHLVHKTGELAHLQVDALKEVDKWLWDCGASDKLLGCYVIKGSAIQGAGAAGTAVWGLASEDDIRRGQAQYAPLDQHFAVTAIREAIRRHTGVKPGQLSDRAIGNALKRLGLARKQCVQGSVGGAYPDWGYSIPDGTALHEAILTANKIKGYVE